MVRAVEREVEQRGQMVVPKGLKEAPVERQGNKNEKTTQAVTYA